jgi:hypothetical protein
MAGKIIYRLTFPVLRRAPFTFLFEPSYIPRRAIPYLPLNPYINRGIALIGPYIVLFSDYSISSSLLWLRSD